MPPSVNHYLGYRAIMKNGKPLAVSYCTNEAKKFKAEFSKYVKEQATIQGWSLEPNEYQHFYVDCVFYFPAKRLDCNNYYKVLLDAITDTGAVWLDDDSVCERANRILYDSENPRIEIVITPVDYIGIFDDASQLEEFESRCVGCSRYKRNCSILKKAKEGRVQDGVSNTLCEFYKKTKEN